MNVLTGEKILLLIFLFKGISLKVILPNKIDALSGSCVLIKCIKIDTSTPYETPEGISKSPPPPTLMFYSKRWLLLNSPVLEGSSVILSCWAKTLCSYHPPVLTWSSYPKLHLSESSRQPDQTQLISDLNFNVTHLHHTVNFICTITYQLKDKKKTAQTNYTLYVQYAPKMSPSSSCKRADVTVCFCEVHGNPFPNLTWFISDNPVANSTCTSVSEERLDDTVLRSTFTLSYFLKTEHSVQCVATNIYGNASRQFHLDPLPNETAYCAHKTLSLLITLALVVLLYALTVGAGFYKIKQLSTKLKAKREAEAPASVQCPNSNNIYENLHF
ncbi:uncharacterized protein LOC130436715 [Triplophysa dalaica]|uniref:uncharacterized protein LOC130436715 n=1 Tax=Triplophysa dalaica TaxID=1582913 RepID=UPI0024DF8836|nr:uncharacterized protein LOC130436715 [Triplophysa dalaica]